MPSARSITTTACEERGDDQADDQQITEHGVELCGFEVDHRDCALLSRGAQLRRADLADEERQREHGEQRPCRKQADHHSRRERDIRADDERDIQPMRGRASGLHRKRLRARAGVLADVAPLVAMQDRGDEQTDWDARGDGAEVKEPAHCVERPDHHERPHQEEHERDPDGTELVLERWGRVRIAADEADDPEGDDGPAARGGEDETHDHGDRERCDREPVRGPVADATLHDRVAGAR